MNDVDPHHFALRQADQAREGHALVMAELDLVKEQVARLPTRSETLKLALGCLAAVVVALLPIR
jgi:hypothetical protein